MSEYEIELKIEKAMDRLDRMLMDGRISQDQYDHEVWLLDQWANRKLKAA